MPVDGMVRTAHGAEAEVVRPPQQQPVQLRDPVLRVPPRLLRFCALRTELAHAAERKPFCRNGLRHGMADHENGRIFSL